MEHYVIVGSGSGIGAELARILAAPDVGLLLHTGSNDQRLAAMAESCRAAGAHVETCVGLTEAPALVETIEAWAAGLADGALTGFIFAAGYAKLGHITDTAPHDLEEALRAMPLAFHRLTALLAPKLSDRRGRILCISAFGAHRSKTHSYCATAPAKAAMEAQVRVFAANLAPRGITVNAVVPGFVEKEPGTPSSLTPQQWGQVSAGIPMGRIGRRREIAALAAFLLSENAGYVTGQSIHANGGLTL